MAEVVRVSRTEAARRLDALREAARAVREDFAALPASEQQEGRLILQRVQEKAEQRREQVSDYRR